MKKNKLFNKAEKLRRDGHSLREISQKLKISKSTASSWLRNVSISKKGLKRLDRLSEDGVRRARLILVKKKKEYFQLLSDKCRVLRACS